MSQAGDLCVTCGRVARSQVTRKMVGIDLCEARQGGTGGVVLGACLSEARHPVFGFVDR